MSWSKKARICAGVNDMDKFHSTVSRRDFMKGLGLAGAGLGTAAATSPVFHDLDEVLSSSSGDVKRSWWVKEVDEPTVEIDWNVIDRYDARYTAHSEAVMGRYLGLDEYRESLQVTWSTGYKSSKVVDSINANTPGDNLVSAAISDAAWGGLSRNTGLIKWHGPETTLTPEQRGVPKWQGTPEENTRILRVAMRFFGAHNIGAAALDEKHKRLVCTHPQSVSGAYMNSWPPPDTVNKRIVFEDVDQGYSTSEKFVIPTKPMWAVSYTTPMSREMFRTAPSGLRSAANAMRYRNRGPILIETQNFVRALGYQVLEEPYPCIPAIAGAVLSGLAENGRNGGFCNSPDFGSVNGYYDLLTDLPMAPTKPIDAGMWRFCHTCRKCAEACPAQAISMDSEPSWDPPKSRIIPKLPALNPNMPDPEFHQPGKKIMWHDSIACDAFGNSQPYHCGICMATCTFNTNTGASIHDVVHAVLSTTSAFNGFLWNMDKTFGYGLAEGAEKDRFWEMSLPQYGFDTTIGAADGGYAHGGTRF
ncbi:MAG: reductive dehalogenase [Dehalococcoides mccartyi]|uniref:reductive dehalogenase n=1 Tax=Dehalococcoides mccartyi TaxID=61435 RepID=UPI0030F67D64